MKDYGKKPIGEKDKLLILRIMRIDTCVIRVHNKKNVCESTAMAS